MGEIIYNVFLIIGIIVVLTILVVVAVKGNFNRGENWGKSYKKEWGIDDNKDYNEPKPFC